MKKIFIFLIILLLPCMAYADSAVQALTDITSPETGDDMYIVDNPDVTPASKKINIGALLAVANDLDSSGDVTDDSHNHVTTNIDAATSVAWNAQVSDNTGSGLLVFNDSPTFVTPILGTIASGVGTALTALDGENIQNDTIDDDSIDLTDITLADFTNDSGYLTTVDISSDTNLSAGNNITLNGDTIDVDTLTASDISDLNGATDITADLEEETHASEHSDGGADEITADNLATSCSDGQILEASSGGWVCGADDTGSGGDGTTIDIQDSGSPIVSTSTVNFINNLSVSNVGGVATVDVSDSYIVNDANDTMDGDFNLTTGKKVTVNSNLVISATTLGSGVVSSSLTSVGTIGTGTWQGSVIDHERGGLEADVSGYSNGLFGTDGASTIDVDTEGELETALGGLDVVTITASDITSANLATALSDEDNTGLCGADKVCMGGHEHAGANLTDDLFVLTAGDTMTGNLVIDDSNIQITEVGDTMTISVPALTSARAVTFPDAAGEVSLLGQSISVAELTQVGSPDSTKYLNGAGTWTTIEAGSGHTIQDEGGDLTARTNLNFVGAGVECTDDAGNDQTDCTISGGGTGSLDDGYNNSPTVLVDAGAVFFNSDSTTSGAFSIDGEQTTVDMVLFDGQALTTGDALQITVDSTAMTTGKALNIYDANATASIFTVDDVGATSIGQGSSGSIDYGTNTMTDSIVGNLLTDQIHLAAMSWNVSGTFVIGSPVIDHKGAHRLSLPADADSAAAYQVYIPNTFGSTPVLKGNISQTVTEAATNCGIEVDVKCTSPSQAEAFWLNSGFDTINDPGGLTLGATLDYLVSFSISLTNNDSMTAGDTCMIRVNRDIDDDDGATGSCLFTDMILEWNR